MFIENIKQSKPRRGGMAGMIGNIALMPLLAELFPFVCFVSINMPLLTELSH